MAAKAGRGLGCGDGGVVRLALLCGMLACLARGAAGDAATAVTCGSAVKVTHAATGYRLHSHTIAWGSGSRMQSVTAHPNPDDPNSLWLVKEALGEVPCQTGVPVRCGATVRLQHVNTNKNLHTHDFKAPLSGQGEVCGFPDAESDEGDNWRIECTGADDVWRVGAFVEVVNVRSGVHLHSHDSYRFDRHNCQRCPILGQQEVTALHSPGDPNNAWVVREGLLVEPDA